MSDVGVTSDVVTTKKPRKSYKEDEEDEFDEEQEEEVADANGANGDAGGDEEEGDDDEELEEDEFVVEKIFSHYIADDVRYHRLPRLLLPPRSFTTLTARTGIAAIRGQMGGLRKEGRSNMGGGGQSQVRQPPGPPVQQPTI